MSKIRTDLALVNAGLAHSRSQAENFIKMGQVRVGNKHIKKPGELISADEIKLLKLKFISNYVSRAAYKLESASKKFKLDYKNKVILDIGSSTGGFTDYALNHGASRVIAVEKGKNQLHPSLINNPLIELHEKTDIRDFRNDQSIDLILIDVSFISIREILINLDQFTKKDTQVVALVKPQFEAVKSNLKHRGVIKNENMRRQILRDFEIWVKDKYLILNKSDSVYHGAKG
ncbi:MAG TPA: TlyA family RNA methyltransferase, partial [Patescibacteria group bacterium]|nr:TlyA family RNA methyltransferase [Patescibacteria group bacterium]